VRSAVALAGIVFLVSSCGGSSNDTGDGGTSAPAAGSLESLWRAPGEDVAAVSGTSVYEPGDVRVSFLVVNGRGREVVRPTAKVWVARGLKQKPFQQTTADYVPVGVPGGEEPASLFVTHLKLEQPGTYWFLAEPVGAKPKIQAVGTIKVTANSPVPGPGDVAPRSKTPTLATTPLKDLTTDRTPDRELYRESVAQAIANREPTVVAFATPLFCASRTCGPIVDVVSRVRKATTGVRFIHVEIYEDNDPAKGTNQWVDEWKLPTEPWIFLVGPDGKVKERFEGAVSAQELADAIVREFA
jgi:hypothetical protein